MEFEREKNKRTVLLSSTWGTFREIYNAPVSHISSAPTIQPCNIPSNTFHSFTNQRHDIETYCSFVHAFEKKRPSAMHLALGMTDSWAHHKDYKQHLMHLELADYIVKDISVHMQPDYMVVTTDHGRGNGKGWVDHGNRPIDAGCENSWCMLICKTEQHKQKAQKLFSSMKYLEDVYHLLVFLCDS